MSEILKLIKDYQDTVRLGVEEMRKEFKTQKLLKGWKTKAIPKHGILNSGLEYDFHGYGCFITVNNITVNFDFGPNDRCDGFDEWRLGCFVNEKPETYKQYAQNPKLLEIDFQKLIDDKVIIIPSWFEETELYYMVDMI